MFLRHTFFHGHNSVRDALGGPVILLSQSNLGGLESSGGITHSLHLEVETHKEI